jgi:hypothetical protein
MSPSNGGGIHRGTTNVNGYIRNSIIAGNSGVAASPDVTNSANGIASQGNNLIGTVGTSTGWVASDILNTPALISPAGNYGGPGMTFALLSGSAAIDGGHNCVLDLTCSANNPPAPVITDQRGAARPSGSSVDIGSYEVNSSYRADLPQAELSVPYNFVITPDAGSFTYSVTSGSLPPGLMLGTSSVKNVDILVPEAAIEINGTPTQAGTFDFSITITNGSNSAVVNYRIVVGGSAAAATGSGRVITSNGFPARGAIVTLEAPSGTRYVRLSNNFGNFVFEGIPTGVTYLATARVKGEVYPSQMIQVNGDINNVVFSPQSTLQFKFLR